MCISISCHAPMVSTSCFMGGRGPTPRSWKPSQPESDKNSNRRLVTTLANRKALSDRICLIGLYARGLDNRLTSTAYPSELLPPGHESGTDSQFHLPTFEHFLY